MTTIQFELGGGASIALPAATVAEKLIERLSAQRTPPLPARPKIGEYLSGQGGIYVGDILGADGVLYGLITPVNAVGSAKWGNDGERDLSDLDGQDNTRRLHNQSPAAKLAAEYEADGHADFYLPARRELIVAAANVPSLFEQAYHWTSTPYGEHDAWAVDFEDGSVYRWNRDDEFLVRPFRRFTHSSL